MTHQLQPHKTQILLLKNISICKEAICITELLIQNSINYIFKLLVFIDTFIELTAEKIVQIIMDSFCPFQSLIGIFHKNKS